MPGSEGGRNTGQERARRRNGRGGGRAVRGKSGEEGALRRGLSAFLQKGLAKNLHSRCGVEWIYGRGGCKRGQRKQRGIQSRALRMQGADSSMQNQNPTSPENDTVGFWDFHLSGVGYMRHLEGQIGVYCSNPPLRCEFAQCYSRTIGIP